jgi:hypothetical protein
MILNVANLPASHSVYNEVLVTEYNTLKTNTIKDNL